MSIKWTVLVPLRALPSAKSRLAAELPAEVHRDLVDAIRADTLEAVHDCAAVARVVVIGDRPGSGVTLVQKSDGLNGALRDGAQLAAASWPDDGVAALVGDLPALRADDLGAVLVAAEAQPAGFVPDAAGTGTTVLTAMPGTMLDPHYGVGSARRHRAIAVELAAPESVRADVDTVADLDAAARIGLGRRTAAAADLIRRSS